MKYYVGVKYQSHAWIFRSPTVPTNDSHPVNVRFCFGGYPTRKQAEQVAMYQGYVIENDWREFIPKWEGMDGEKTSPDVAKVFDKYFNRET